MHLACCGLSLSRGVGLSAMFCLTFGSIAVTSVISDLVANSPVNPTHTINSLLLIFAGIVGLLGVKTHSANLVTAFSWILLTKVLVGIIVAVIMLSQLKDDVTSAVDKLIAEITKDAVDHGNPPPAIDRDQMINTAIHVFTFSIIFRTSLFAGFSLYCAKIARALVTQIKSETRTLHVVPNTLPLLADSYRQV